MDSVNLRQDLIDRFGHDLGGDEEVVEECINICQAFNISANDLFYKWEAYNYTNARKTPSEFNLDSALALKAQIQRNIAMLASGKAATQNNPLVSFSRRFATTSTKVNLGTAEANNGSSINTAIALERSGPTESVKKTFAIKVTLETSDVRPYRKNHSVRYMYERISSRSEALDDRIDEMAETVREHYNLPGFGDPASLSEDIITVIGSIAINSELSSSNALKLMEMTIALQASRSMGSGAIVPLRFDRQLKIRGDVKGTGRIGLFPGAIVTLRGKNGGGGWFLVTEVLTAPSLEMPPAILEKNLLSHGDGPFSMCICSGPYSPDKDLNFKNWHQLLKAIKTASPDLILLLGPFIDVSHAKIAEGDTDQSPVSLFREHFVDQLHAYLSEYPESTVLLVPSVRDIISDHAVFPQSGLHLPFSSHPRIHLLPNPCQFSINDISFAVTSVDVLFHLQKEEFLLFGEGSDAVPAVEDFGDGVMANLCRHLLQQRSFYPIFPVPCDLSQDVNVDISQTELIRLGVKGFAPDVLILPSKLKQFSKDINNTLAINPSFVSKGNYSILTVDRVVSKAVNKRLQVELLKISSL